MKKIILFLIVFIPLSAFSQAKTNTVFQFLKLSNSPRIEGSGGENISLYNDDLTMALNNPALLNSSMTKKVSVNYAGYFKEIKSGATGFAYEHEKYGIFAIGINYFSYGKFAGFDETGVSTGEFKASDYAFNLLYAKDLFKNFRAGINFKNIISQYEIYKSYGIAFDLGLNYRTENDFSFALCGKNIGTQIKPYYKGHYEKLPFDLQAGVSKKLAHAPFTLSITAHNLHKPNLSYDLPYGNDITIFDTGTEKENGKFINFLDNSLRHIVLGVEFSPIKSFYFNLGYNHKMKKEMTIYNKSGIIGISWGFGLKLKKFQIAYSRSKYHFAGGVNNFSITLNLDKLKGISKENE